MLTSNKLLFRNELSYNSTVRNMSDVVVSLPVFTEARGMSRIRQVYRNFLHMV